MAAMAAHGDGYRQEEKLRLQVDAADAARRLLSGSLGAQINIDELCNRPGAGVLRPILEDAFRDQVRDMYSAQEILHVLDEMSQEYDLERVSRGHGHESAAAAGAEARLPPPRVLFLHLPPRGPWPQAGVRPVVLRSTRPGLESDPK